MMTLEEISAHSEIYQVLMRYCRGVDRSDVDLLKSVYHPGALDRHGVFQGTGHEFAEYIVANMEDSALSGQHHITNVSIEMDGAYTARVESYYIAWHPVPDEETGGEQLVQVGGRYLDKFEMREDIWLIADRLVIIDWSELGGTNTQWPNQVAFPGGAPREQDPSHAFFLGK